MVKLIGTGCSSTARTLFCMGMVTLSQPQRTLRCTEAAASTSHRLIELRPRQARASVAFRPHPFQPVSHDPRCIPAKASLEPSTPPTMPPGQLTIKFLLSARPLQSIIAIAIAEYKCKPPISSLERDLKQEATSPSHPSPPKTSPPPPSDPLPTPPAAAPPSRSATP